MKKVLLLVIIVCICSSCNTLKHVRKEIGQQGFKLWYPAEANIMPGQIWQVNRKKVTQYRLKPSVLLVEPENSSKIDATKRYLVKNNEAQFKTLKKEIDAGFSLNADFNSELVNSDKADKLGALLRASTVKDINLNLGKTRTYRLVYGELYDSATWNKLDNYYKKLIKGINSNNPRYRDLYLITDVIYTSGMKYVIKCTNTGELEAKTGEIKKLLKAEAKLKIIDKTTATLEIPVNSKLVIGVIFRRGEDLIFDPNISQLRSTVPVNSIKLINSVVAEKIFIKEKGISQFQKMDVQGKFDIYQKYINKIQE